MRLRHNVIRAGLRRISLAYSRISLADVASKLGLPNVEDTESIVTKAIRYIQPRRRCYCGMLGTKGIASARFQTVKRQH